MGETDVLVIGAGPTGLLAAICLRLNGVGNVRIVEALDAPSEWAKAPGIQPRSLQILEQIGGGVIKEIEEGGLQSSGMEIFDYDGGHPVVGIEIDKCKSETAILHEQWRTERVLTRRLSELGVEIERGMKVSKFTDDGSSVKVEMESGETIFARYVVGCDGAHSITRHLLGIEFSGEKFPGSYALVHCMVDDTSLHPGVVRVGVGKNGWIFTTPLTDGSWIFVFDLNDEERATCSPDKPTLEDMSRLVSERGVRVGRAHSPLWRTYFNVHSRQAERYSSGRVFLCGDAAHIHSPLGGQGMNMGMQDAHNLAWKLALVVKGEAAESLLDSYHDERHGVDSDVLRFVERMHMNLTARDPSWVAVRNRAMRTVSGLQFVVDEILLPRLGQTSYTYRSSTLSRESWGRVSMRHPLLRRSQNLLRVLGRRIRAGDRGPDCELELIRVSIDTDGRSEQSTCLTNMRLYEWTAEAGSGFKALIFTGLSTHRLSTDQDDLRSFAKNLLGASRGLISGAAIVPEDPKTYNLIGVHGQCLMLIRPDGYVCFRQEPLSVDVTLAYLADAVRATRVRGHGALCTTGPDPITRIVLSAFLLNLGYVVLGVWTGQKTAKTYGIGSLLALFGAWTFTEVKRDW